MAEQIGANTDSLPAQNLPPVVPQPVSQQPISVQSLTVKPRSKWVPIALLLCLGIIIFEILFVIGSVKEPCTEFACILMIPIFWLLVFDIFLMAIGGIGLLQGRSWGAKFLFVYQLFKIIPFLVLILLSTTSGNLVLIVLPVAMVIILFLPLVVFYQAKKSFDIISNDVSQVPNIHEVTLLTPTETSDYPVSFRWLAASIDSLIFGIPIYLISLFYKDVIYQYLFGFVKLSDSLLSPLNKILGQDLYSIVVFPILWIVPIIIPIFLFEILLNSYLTFLFGQTLGKKVYGIKVVKTDGSKLTLFESLKREVIKMIIPFSPLSILFDPKKRGFHDQFTGTIVLRVGNKASKISLNAISLIVIAITFYQPVKSFIYMSLRSKPPKSVTSSTSAALYDKSAYKYDILITNSNCKIGYGIDCGSTGKVSNSDLNVFTDMRPSTNYKVTVCNSDCKTGTPLSDWNPKECLSNKNKTLTVNVINGSCY